MTARTIMVQGTASSVGKSLIVAGLCRMFRQDGLSVAPFKSQNMALNAYVTLEGGEIGRAQAVQAEAARIAPSVDMNPILLKPEGDSRSQVVVLGKSVGRMSAAEYHARKPELRETVRSALDRLRAVYDLVVIEGAGSPAEINLKDRDIVNMFVADIADSPVLLVGDIDRGGVFAAFVGTLELLEPHERARVKAFIVNKFRGDVGLLEPGLRYIEERTGVPVLGVLPYLPQLRIADEDSMSLEQRRGCRRAGPEEIEIAVVRLPRMANYDDFQPLEHEPGVVVRFIDQVDEMSGADLVILPGTKSTIADLRWLRESGFAAEILGSVAGRRPLVGVCGGCQMLGKLILDPQRVEADEACAEGLGLLPIRTNFESSKRTSQVVVRAASASFLCEQNVSELSGYEIHFGRVERLPGASGAFEVLRRGSEAESDLDGCVSADGMTVGSMIHGLFDNVSVRKTLIAFLARRKGIEVARAPDESMRQPIRDEYDRLAQSLRDHLDLVALKRMIAP